MKRKSKLFLLVAGIIFAAGVLLCLVALGVGSSTDEQLFAAKVGEDKVYTYKFGDGETDKIKISVTDADVNIYGGSDRSYMEVVNFNENLCSYSGNSAVISFKEASEIKDITGFWESGLSFKGLRYLLLPTSGSGKKTVNVYIDNIEYVKIFDITVGKGNVTVTGIDSETDINVSLKSGTVALADIETESCINVKAVGDIASNVSFKNVNARNVTVNAKRAKFVGEGFISNECTMNITTGSVTTDITPELPQYEIRVQAKGKLTVDTEPYLDFYKYSTLESTQGGEGDEETELSIFTVAGDDLSVSLDTPAAEGSDNTEEQQ